MTSGLPGIHKVGHRERLAHLKHRISLRCEQSVLMFLHIFALTSRLKKSQAA